MRVIFSCMAAACLLVLSGCGGDTPPETAAATAAPVAPAQSEQQLRERYQKYYAALPDTLPTYQAEAEGKLYPVDEAPLDTAFFVFREQLRESVRNKDVMAVLSMIDTNIQIGFGAENGQSAFVKQWELGTPEQNAASPLWQILGDVLDKGGTFTLDADVFFAPYVYSTWPEQYDPFEYAALTGEGVRLRSQPGLKSQVLATISYDIVRVLTFGEEDDVIDGKAYTWDQVELSDGKQGYIYGQFLYQPVNWRAGFQRGTDGRWLMNMFLAGD